MNKEQNFFLIQYDQANNLPTRNSKLLNRPDKLLTKSLIYLTLQKIFIFIHNLLKDTQLFANFKLVK